MSESALIGIKACGNRCLSQLPLYWRIAEIRCRYFGLPSGANR
ncbi:hypothetical protein QN415_19360 [Pseudomonas sp. 5S4]|nr:hypothetical protein [Pseudomonas sp. 10S5]MEB0199352.1 hypothetical protein [Pseudomonas sp. 5S4]MEB0244106.1 hypothetical protein [Pseudomonas sp. 10S5]